VSAITPIVNNILAISWLLILLVEETRVPGENHWPAISHWQTLSHNVVSSTPRYELDSNSQLKWWFGTNRIGSCKPNYQRGSSFRKQIITWTAMVIFKIRRYWRFTKNSDASNSLSCVKEVLNMMGKNTFGKLFTNLWFSRTTLCDKVYLSYNIFIT
jgi:hypothetical protein